MAASLAREPNGSQTSSRGAEPSMPWRGGGRAPAGLSFPAFRMAPLETLVADTALAASLLSSVVLANCWGELSAPPAPDAPTLTVFAAALAFTPVRWVLGLLALGLAVAHGAFCGLFGGGVVSLSVLVGVHTMLGGLSLWWLDAGVRRIRRDRGLPRFFGLLGGVVLPLPIFVMTAVGCNDWLGAGPGAFAGCAVVVFTAHFVSYRSGRNTHRLARPLD